MYGMSTGEMIMILILMMMIMMDARFKMRDTGTLHKI